MIKLIASDMDGTLLDDEGRIPSETFDLIRDLRKAGIRFAASSGRCCHVHQACGRCALIRSDARRLCRFLLLAVSARIGPCYTCCTYNKEVRHV